MKVTRNFTISLSRIKLIYWQELLKSSLIYRILRNSTFLQDDAMSSVWRGFCWPSRRLHSVAHRGSWLALAVSSLEMHRGNNRLRSRLTLGAKSSFYMHHEHEMASHLPPGCFQKRSNDIMHFVINWHIRHACCCSWRRYMLSMIAAPTATPHLLQKARRMLFRRGLRLSSWWE